jgi:hypothetical protein
MGQTAARKGLCPLCPVAREKMRKIVLYGEALTDTIAVKSTRYKKAAFYALIHC